MGLKRALVRRPVAGQTAALEVAGACSLGPLYPPKERGGE